MRMSHIDPLMGAVPLPTFIKEDPLIGAVMLHQHEWVSMVQATVDLHVFVSLLLFFRDACQANVLLGSQSRFLFLLKSSRHARPTSTHDISAALA